MKLKKFNEFVNESLNMSAALKKALAELDVPTTREDAIDYLQPMIQLYQLGLSDDKFDLIDLEVVSTERRFGMDPEGWNQFLSNIKQYGAIHESSFGVTSFTSKPTPPNTQLWAEMFTMPLAAFFVFQEEIRELLNGNEDNFEGPKMIGSPTKRDLTWNHWLKRVLSTKN